jgi:hypothetical protein
MLSSCHWFFRGKLFQRSGILPICNGYVMLISVVKGRLMQASVKPLSADVQSRELPRIAHTAATNVTAPDSSRSHTPTKQTTSPLSPQGENTTHHVPPPHISHPQLRARPASNRPAPRRLALITATAPDLFHARAQGRRRTR